MAAAELHSLWLECPPKPARMGGTSGYIMRDFAKAPQYTLTKATTESCSCIAWQSMQYSFRILGNRGYVSKRVRSLSILHFIWHLFKTLGEPVQSCRVYARGTSNTWTCLKHQDGPIGTKYCIDDAQDEAMPLVEWALTPMGHSWPKEEYASLIASIIHLEMKTWYCQEENEKQETKKLLGTKKSE